MVVIDMAGTHARVAWIDVCALYPWFLSRGSAHHVRVVGCASSARGTRHLVKRRPLRTWSRLTASCHPSRCGGSDAGTSGAGARGRAVVRSAHGASLMMSGHAEAVGTSPAVGTTTHTRRRKSNTALQALANASCSSTATRNEHRGTPLQSQS
jgi:hypothetical protein